MGVSRHTGNRSILKPFKGIGHAGFGQNNFLFAAKKSLLLKAVQSAL